MKRRRLLMVLVLCCALLTGCAGQPQGMVSETLPLLKDPYTAPIGDLGGQYTMLATLYLPSADGTQLVPLTEEIAFDSGRSEAETIAKALLNHKGGEDYHALPGDGAVTLSGPDAVVVSCGIATVNLSVAALSLNHTDFFVLCQALANTLCEVGDVTGVNILVAGVSPGLDIAATLPLGLMVKNLIDDPAMLMDRLITQRTGGRTHDTPFRVGVALYFPARSGRGILAESRMLTLPDANISDMALALLSALSTGAEELENIPQMPDLLALLSRPPQLDEGAQNILRLSFQSGLNDALAETGITRSVMIASLVTTMASFLPNVPLISVTIGNEQITALTPAGLYTGANQTIGFSGGHMRRGDFANFLLTETPLYFPDSTGALKGTLRALPCAYARSARALFEQLLTGPLFDDTISGLSGALPSAVSSADLIGIRREGDTLLLNFTPAFQAACQALTESGESALVYAIVNTMTVLPGVRRVRFYIDGTQPDTLAGALVLTGEFMRAAPTE